MRRWRRVWDRPVGAGGTSAALAPAGVVPVLRRRRLGACTLLVLLAAGALAGCAEEPDRLNEKWILNVVAREPYTLDVPLLLHGEGPDLEGWQALWRESRGRADFAVVGSWLRVDSTGTMTAEAGHWQQSDACCLTDYLGATWSAGQDADAEGLRIHVVAGALVSVSLHYVASNETCWREANYFTGRVEGPGEVLLQGVDQQGCTSQA